MNALNCKQLLLTVTKSSSKYLGLQTSSQAPGCANETYFIVMKHCWRRREEMKNNIYFVSFLAFAAVGWVLRSSERWRHVTGRFETQQDRRLSHKGEKQRTYFGRLHAISPPEQRSPYSDTLRAGRSRDLIPVERGGGRGFLCCPNRPRELASLLYNGYRVIPGG